MMTINCMIVDDEPIARDILINYVNRLPMLNLIKVCMNATEAFEGICEHKIDLIFLDIQMPVISGVEFLRSLRNPPFVIFTTAYSDFALEGYELDLVDYLLKPVTLERFYQAVQKVEDRTSHKKEHPAVQETIPDYTFVKHDSRLVRINYDEVKYIHADRDYSYIHFTNGKKWMLGIHLKTLEDMLPDNWFIRVHRSFLVNWQKITSINKNNLEIDGTEIPIGPLYRDAVFNKLPL